MQPMKRGQRQSERMRSTIEAAFRELLREQDYDSITVSDIIERANVGRSTFYRHFETKTDLLIALHEGMFVRLNLGVSSRDDWLSEAPNASLIDFLTRIRHHDRMNPVYFTISRDYTYSREMTLISQRVTGILVGQIEAGLRQAFGDQPTAVQLNLLAAALAGLYMGTLRWWLMQMGDVSAEQTATQLQRLVRANVWEALNPTVSST
jgi:AcrR family transcriptional regulator